MRVAGPDPPVARLEGRTLNGRPHLPYPSPTLEGEPQGEDPLTLIDPSLFSYSSYEVGSFRSLINRFGSSRRECGCYRRLASPDLSDPRLDRRACYKTNFSCRYNYSVGQIEILV